MTKVSMMRMLALGLVVTGLGIVVMDARLSDAFAQRANDTLSAYYQCHNRTSAAREVLRRFRSVYPTAPIHMRNDGGNPDLEGLAKEFHATYVYDARLSDSPITTIITNATRAKIWVQRVIDSAQGVDWVMLLEDDVWVKAPTPLDQLQYDVNGGVRYLYFKGCMVDELVQNRTDLSAYVPHLYAGNGGCILRGEALRRIRPGDVDILFNHCPHMAQYTDILLSALIYLTNGSVGPWPGYEEVSSWHQIIRWGRIEVLHNEKRLYN